MDGDKIIGIVKRDIVAEESFSVTLDFTENKVESEATDFYITPHDLLYYFLQCHVTK